MQKKNRAEFSVKTKLTLAKRVAFRCSFLGCNRLTVGPGHDGDDHSVSLGDAAHIYGASVKGPRSNPALSEEDRSSIKNGIWMCTPHARLIDDDEIIYSAETLNLWKKKIEEDTYYELTNLERPKEKTFQTLIKIYEIVFGGTWITMEKDRWVFEVEEFVIGNIGMIREMSSNFNELNSWTKYVLVESQGDGRAISGLNWSLNGHNKFQISCEILPKAPRTNPQNIGSDFAFDDDFDLNFENGDFAMVEGVDSAIQIIRSTLSIKVGTWALEPLSGSRIAEYYKQYGTNARLFNLLVKLEIVRLFTIKVPSSLEKSLTPDFNFINRVISTSVMEFPNNEGYLMIKLELEWGNYEYWSDIVRVAY